MEARLRMLSKLNWIQTIGLGLVSGLLWFQIPRKESSIPDIRGWVSLPFLILGPYQKNKTDLHQVCVLRCLKTHQIKLILIFNSFYAVIYQQIL